MLGMGKRSSQLLVGVNVIAIGMAMLPAIATAMTPRQVQVPYAKGYPKSIEKH